MGQFSIRLSEILHCKARILGAYKNVSLNEICARAIQEYIEHWEDTYGEIPLPPDEELR